MEVQILKPARVERGDTVAVVSPCSPVVSWWEHRAQRACAYLESLGLRVRIMPGSGASNAGAPVSPRARAEDLHAAFLDPTVKVVLAAIGGDHAIEVLPHLDYGLIRSNPKVFQGYSDVTVLHWALLKHAGLVTFHGPALLSELGEHPRVLADTDRSLRAAWFGDTPLRFRPSEVWTDEFLNWNRQLDLTRPRELRPNAGWVTIHEGVAEGPLVGGCLETICRHLKGSGAWLDLAGALLFLETSEEVPPLDRVDAHLADLVGAGVFEQIAGLVIGRPYGYDHEQVTRLWTLATRWTQAANLPVLGNVECGHTDPMLTLPLGVRARLDATARTFETLEPAVIDPPGREASKDRHRR